jgi:hypothetical protein
VKRVMLRCFTTLVARPLDTLRHQFHPFLAKMKMCHPVMGHDVGRVIASLHPRNVFLHLAGHLIINLVVLVVVLLLDGEKFLVREEDVFVPILSMPLQETFCSCPSDRLQSSSKDVSL